MLIKLTADVKALQPRVKALNAISMPEKLFSTKQSDTLGSMLPSVSQHCLCHGSLAEAESKLLLISLPAF